MRNFVSLIALVLCVTIFVACSDNVADTTTETQDVSSSSQQTDVAKSGDMRYIMKINIKQSHFTLNIGEHIKDGMNDIDIIVAVDEDFYNKYEIGDKLSDDFRWGSFLMKGSIGKWKVTVSDKQKVIE